MVQGGIMIESKELSHITELVFEGGGVKGCVYPGAIQALEEQGLTKDINRVAGASAGALVSAVFALGATAEELKQITFEQDFNRYTDGKWWRGGYDLLMHKGYHSGQPLLKDVQAIIAARVTAINNAVHTVFSQKKDSLSGEVSDDYLLSDSPTFAELEKTKEFLDKHDSPMHCRSLYVMVVKTTEGFASAFSAETQPHVKISDAVVASASIPLYFQARRLDTVGGIPQMGLATRANTDTYIDGGTQLNFPIGVFDEMKYIDPSHQEGQLHAINPHTLGLRVDSPDEIARHHGEEYSAAKSPDSGLFTHVKGVVGAMMSGQEKRHLPSHHNERTIRIPTIIDTTQFDITLEDKQGMIDAGYAATLEYLRSHGLVINAQYDELQNGIAEDLRDCGEIEREYKAKVRALKHAFKETREAATPILDSREPTNLPQMTLYRASMQRFQSAKAALEEGRTQERFTKKVKFK